MAPRQRRCQIWEHGSAGLVAARDLAAGEAGAAGVRGVEDTTPVVSLNLLVLTRREWGE